MAPPFHASLMGPYIGQACTLARLTQNPPPPRSRCSPGCPCRPSAPAPGLPSNAGGAGQRRADKSRTKGHRGLGTPRPACRQAWLFWSALGQGGRLALSSPGRRPIWWGQRIGGTLLTTVRADPAASLARLRTGRGEGL